MATSGTKTFALDIADTIEEAYEAIKNRGNDYCNYTILPYIHLT